MTAAIWRVGLDPLIAVGEERCRRRLSMCACYHNEAGSHQTMGGNAPMPGWIEIPANGRAMPSPSSATCGTATVEPQVSSGCP